jgi:hypothetical protein
MFWLRMVCMSASTGGSCRIEHGIITLHTTIAIAASTVMERRSIKYTSPGNLQKTPKNVRMPDRSAEIRWNVKRQRPMPTSTVLTIDFLSRSARMNFSFVSQLRQLYGRPSGYSYR